MEVESADSSWVDAPFLEASCDAPDGRHAVDEEAPSQGNLHAVLLPHMVVRRGQHGVGSQCAPVGPPIDLKFRMVSSIPQLHPATLPLQP